jgi:endonuclease/exonuclease/phosphatase family metal-dependent hydrolase
VHKGRWTKSLLTRFLSPVLIILVPLLAAPQNSFKSTTPEFLSFDELVALSETDQPVPRLKAKLKTLLNTPMVGDKATSTKVKPRRPADNGLGRVLRAACWNIERGLNFDLIRLALSDPEGFQQAAARLDSIDEEKISEIQKELRVLRDSDVLLLNEVDLGMKRTDYRDVAKDLAHALGMSYVFGVEFVEVDRLEDLGIDPVRLDDPALAEKMQAELKPDPARYLGLHGNAILSRYPLQNPRMYRLPVCHDWFRTEKAEISALEKGKRLSANKLFLERIEREVRQGGRMALIADIKVPELEGGLATLVSAHLENRCKPACRRKQMDALLEQIKGVDHPLILAGDLNTTGTDGTPTSIRREILERVKNYEFWATQALKWATPAALPLLTLTPVKYFKNYLDPTAIHLPVIGSNREARLFKHVERFRFADNRAFDFRGETERNHHRKQSTLANSNQRARKGFEPTFIIKRDFGGLVGRYKLDWFFVKPFIPRPRGEAMSYKFAPHFPLTMRDLNSAVPDGVSDHAPMTVDLPFAEPALAETPGTH